MTGKLYYLTTLGAWRRHVARFVHSHWVTLAAESDPTDEQTNIFVQVEADEGAHLALEDDPEFSALPHPLTHQAISNEAQRMLEQLGVDRGATTFEAAEAVARAHPLVRHRVF
jgi:hypothetical protein